MTFNLDGIGNGPVENTIDPCEAPLYVGVKRAGQDDAVVTAQSTAGAGGDPGKPKGPGLHRATRMERGD
jgi:hypothetical protein